jgi:proline dehydrogenase
LATAFVPVFIKWKFPIDKLIQNTIFKQFVGGETIHATEAIIQHLNQYKVHVILDYGVEASRGGEAEKDYHAEQFIKAIEFASGKRRIPFISIKISAIADFYLLEKMNTLMVDGEGSLELKYTGAKLKLDASDLSKWELVEKRIHKILGIASLYKIKVLVDAEESWIQDAIDGMLTHAAAYYNQHEAIVFYTIQLYRHDRYEFLKELHKHAIANQLKLGVKVVRGAYMEKERDRAQRMGYESPIHQDKKSTDADFNAAIDFCITHSADIETVVATHNEESCYHAVKQIRVGGNNQLVKKLHFSQLFGMSDHITFNLSKEGWSVSKYLPYGPVKKVVPYLMRRAQENTSVHGQTNRELELIRREMKRRGI